jgi:hypothetical protein
MPEINTTELLNSQSDSIQIQVHTSLPARVVSFNPLDQTVTAELMIEQLGRNGEQLELPPLIYVPVKMFSYGPFMITAEPKKGDEGLVVFSERCIDGWWESGRKSIPLDIRFHDISDAFFDGGYKSKPNALTIVPSCLNMAGPANYIRLMESGQIEIHGAGLLIDAPTTFTQPVIYQAGMTGTGGIGITGPIETDTDLVAAGVSFLDHTNGGEPIDR